MKPTQALIVATPPVATGFALAGVRTEAVSGEHVPERVKELANRPEMGVLLVEDRVLSQMEPADREALDRKVTPVVVPFAGPDWSNAGAGADAYILELLRRAIGYRVRLR